MSDHASLLRALGSIPHELYLSLFTATFLGEKALVLQDLVPFPVLSFQELLRVHPGQIHLYSSWESTQTAILGIVAYLGNAMSQDDGEIKESSCTENVTCFFVLFFWFCFRYFVAVTSYVVIKGFEKLAKQGSGHWKANTKAMTQIIKENAEPPIHMLLLKVLTEPFRRHIQQYCFQLTKLNENLQKDAGVAPLWKALEVYVSLQSYISQCLDEASVTKNLWTILSKKLTVALCTPERRLQEDSRSVPVTVTSSRYDRVLLFNDYLVFLQSCYAHIQKDEMRLFK
ncbi:ALS2 C-terminal-like protein [Lithobates pipiens]